MISGLDSGWAGLLHSLFESEIKSEEKKDEIADPFQVKLLCREGERRTLFPQIHWHVEVSRHAVIQSPNYQKVLYITGIPAFMRSNFSNLP